MKKIEKYAYARAETMAELVDSVNSCINDG